MGASSCKPYKSRPRRSEIDTLAEQWAEDGETLETMLQALREDRDRKARG
ncbi:MAG: hypothetical protein R6V13_01105 [Anaerolineae bacterium]